MTWVKGTSTWGAIEHLLAQLACGEVADGSATTVAASDRWVRETTRTITDAVLNSTTTITSATAAFTVADVGSQVIGTGLTLGTTIASVTNGTTAVLSAAATATASGVTVQITTNTIRTPASKDVNTGACSGRAGYWLNIGLQSATTSSLIAGAAGSLTACKTTAVATNNPASANAGRWVSIIRVQTANTAAGNYSTAVIFQYAYDADTGTAYTSGSSLFLSSTGTVTLSAAAGGASVQLTDPSGILTVGTQFIRGFTSTYVGGVDCWPMWYRSSAAAPTFSVAPPGVAGTDYDVIAQPYAPAGDTAVNNIAATSVRGLWFHGLGIKTLTGLGSGPVYTVSFPMALAKLRIYNSGTNGILALDVGQSKKDTLTSIGTFRNSGGLRIPGWAKCFQTPGSVTTASALQYWASITADGIVLALNGDTGSTGKLGVSYFTHYTPTDPTYDVFPCMFNPLVWDYTADQTSEAAHPATQYDYWGLRRRQDGSEGRDWQTRWLRGEHVSAGNSLIQTSGMIGSSDVILGVQSDAATTNGTLPQLTALGVTSLGSISMGLSLPPRQNKPGPDGKWWLYGFTYGQGGWFGVTTPLATESRLIRGASTTRFLFIPETGWGNGDELTDTATSTKYLLLIPDYPGGGVFRVRTTNNTFFGGVAIAEI